MMNWHNQMELLLSEVDSGPSNATFLETLCKDPTINRDIHRKIVRDLTDRIFNTLSDAALDSMDTCDDYGISDDDGPDWDTGDRD